MRYLLLLCNTFSWCLYCAGGQKWRVIELRFLPDYPVSVPIRIRLISGVVMAIFYRRFVLCQVLAWELGLWPCLCL